MARKEFSLCGKTFEELQRMSTDEFAQLLPARERRSLKRERPELHKKVLEHIKANRKNIRTHARDMVITPDMAGITMKVYNGKDWTTIVIEKEMLGHRLGEFALTRKKVAHSAPGVGATRSSAALSVR